MAEVTGTVLTDRLKELQGKYRAPAGREATYKAFEQRAGTATAPAAARQRISLAPRSTETGRYQQDLASIRMDLAELAEEYGKLNADFRNLVGKDKLYTMGEWFRIHGNQIIGRKQAARQIKLDAIGKRGDALEKLVDRMAEVLIEQYQRAVQGQERSEGLQVENVAHLKGLDRKLIESLKGGFYSESDRTAADVEVAKLEKELEDVNSVLVEYETKIRDAQKAGDTGKVTSLTDEVGQVLDIKHGLLDGRLSAEGVVSDIRREILDKAEAVQSVKGATAASRVNYIAINALIESFKELEIKYRHAKEDMIPVFKIQGRIATLGEEGMRMREALLRTAEISQRLMKANADLVADFADKTFQLLQTPLYDPEKARAVEEDLRTKMVELNKLKMEWAQQQQVLVDEREAAHYAKHE